MLTLILAGEVVYMLPFGLTRFFRPSLLEAFGITNTQLGDIFAVYGVLAMIAYFPGGALADRFSARALLTISLLATGLGGIYLATYPGLFGLVMLFGYWGVTTILLFWAAMIRATREWGGDDAQGRAFGILEGGRGIVAVLFATAGVALFAIFMPDDVQSVSDAGRRAALREVILLYSGVTLATGILTWLVIPHRKHIGDSSRSIFKGAFAVLNRPLVWAQAAVIICAYCGYKGLDNYSLYAVQVLGMDEVEGAKLAAIGVYVRPFAAVAAGLFADRWSAAGALRIGFCAAWRVFRAAAGERRAAVPDWRGGGDGFFHRLHPGDLFRPDHGPHPGRQSGCARVPALFPVPGVRFSDRCCSRRRAGAAAARGQRSELAERRRADEIVLNEISLVRVAGETGQAHTFRHL